MLMSENHTTLPFHRVSPGALGVRPGLSMPVSARPGARDFHQRWPLQLRQRHSGGAAAVVILIL